MRQYEQYLSMSLAYLDIGIVATESKNQWNMYQQAIAYQMFHACELFLQFAILHKTEDEQIRESSINELLARYEVLYPEAPYALALPFDCRDVSGKSDEERANIQSHIEQLDPRRVNHCSKDRFNQNSDTYLFYFDSAYFETMKTRFEQIGSKVLGIG